MVNNTMPLLLEAAAAQARGTVEAVRDCGLTYGYKEERISIGEIDWEVTTIYQPSTEAVKVCLEPVEIITESEVPGFLALFGKDSSNRILYELPVAWLPRGVEVFSGE